MIPNFALIIGAMKSGTTTLYHYLKRHPQIATGWNKEPGFFAFEEKWALGLEWYESQFNFDPHIHLYALEASTDYTKYPFCKDVIDRLKASEPRQFKLIYLMRHPLRRIESHARHAERTKREVGQCTSPRDTHTLDGGISPVSFAISRYAYQIDHYSEYYDRGDLLLLTLEQLAEDPNSVFTRVCDFLGIAPIVSDRASLRSNTAEENSSTSPVRGMLYPVWASLYGNSLVRNATKAVVPRMLRAGVYRNVKRWARLQGRFRLTAEEERTLVTALSRDLLRLRDRYLIDAEKEWGIALQHQSEAPLGPQHPDNRA